MESKRNEAAGFLILRGRSFRSGFSVASITYDVRKEVENKCIGKTLYKYLWDLVSA